jgi:hypothetical protein
MRFLDMTKRKTPSRASIRFPSGLEYIVENPVWSIDEMEAMVRSGDLESFEPLPVLEGVGEIVWDQEDDHAGA